MTQIHNNFGTYRLKLRTVRTEKPNPLEPEPKVVLLIEPYETGTECILKIKTGTEEFWNRPSTSV